MSTRRGCVIDVNDRASCSLWLKRCGRWVVRHLPHRQIRHTYTQCSQAPKRTKPLSHSLITPSFSLPMGAGATTSSQDRARLPVWRRTLELTPRLRGLPHAPGCVVIGVPLPFLASIYERSTDPWRADPRAAAAMGVQPT